MNARLGLEPKSLAWGGRPGRPGTNQAAARGSEDLVLCCLGDRETRQVSQFPSQQAPMASSTPGSSPASLAPHAFPRVTRATALVLAPVAPASLPIRFDNSNSVVLTKGPYQGGSLGAARGHQRGSAEIESLLN